MPYIFYCYHHYQTFSFQVNIFFFYTIQKNSYIRVEEIRSIICSEKLSSLYFHSFHSRKKDRKSTFLVTVQLIFIFGNDFLFYFFNKNVSTFLALQCLAFLVYGNSTVASLVVDSALEDGQTLVESVASLMDRNKKIEMQLAAARVVCYLNR